MAKTVFLGPDPRFKEALAAARGAPVTLLIVAACVALFAVAEQHGSTEDVRTLIRFGATERGQVWAGEPWRLVTAAFLHVGIVHLAWNLVAMPGWCIPVERTLGSGRFLVLYLSTAVAASGASLLAHDVVAAGASGAEFGVVGATLVLARRRLGSWRTFVADPAVRGTVGTALLWTIALATSSVDHAAHVGGLVAGLAVAWALTAPPDASRAARRLASGVAAALVLIPAAGALVPRSVPPAYEMSVLADELHEAIQRSDLDAAERILARVEREGIHSTYFEFARGLVHEFRGRYEDAARAYESLARSTDPDARLRGANAAKNLLAWRLATGTGLAADPQRALTMFRELCAAGGASSCDFLERFGASLEGTNASGSAKPASRGER